MEIKFIKLRDYLLSILFMVLTSFTGSFAQSNEILAKSHFLKAQGYYGNQDYKNAVFNLDKAVEYLGTTNAKIEAMYVKSKYYDYQVFERKQHLNKYFKLASEDHSDYIEMVQWASSVNYKAELYRKKIDYTLSQNIKRNWESEGPVNIQGYGYIDKDGKRAFTSFINGTAFTKGENGIASSYDGDEFFNRKGEVVFTCDESEPFKNGYAKVMKKDFKEREFWGVIDSTGQVIVPLKYIEVSDVSDELIIVREHKSGSRIGKFGYYSTSGNIYISISLEAAKPFNDGLAAIATRENDKWTAGYINKEADWFFSYTGYEPHELKLYSFSEGVALINNKYEKRWQILDKQKNRVNLNEDINIASLVTTNNQGSFSRWTNHYPGRKMFQDGLVVAYKNSDKKKRGYLNKKGEVVIPFMYDFASQFEDNVAVVKIDGVYRLINSDGVAIAGTDYDYIIHGNFYDVHKLLLVKKNGEWGYINSNGEVVIPIIYETILHGFNAEGIATAKLNEEYIKIDLKGEKVKEF